MYGSLTSAWPTAAIQGKRAGTNAHSLLCPQCDTECASPQVILVQSGPKALRQPGHSHPSEGSHRLLGSWVSLAADSLGPAGW